MKIKIGPQKFTVMTVKNMEQDGVRLDGQITFPKSIIFLDENLDAFGMKQTLWHEIIHGILTQAGIGPDQYSEAIVEALAYGILSVLDDNRIMQTGTK